MKTTTFFLTFVFLLLSASILAQPNVILQRESSGALTLAIGLATAGDIQVDWGDGVLVTGTAGTTNATANITGTVTGTNTIKLYGAITALQVTNSGSTTLITAADVSNAPTLVKFTLPRNKLTSLDLSHNPAIIYVSVYNNLFNACALDALYTSLPTLTGAGSITIYNNLGALTSKTSLATAKGWTFGSGTVGDGTGCTATAINSAKSKNNLTVSYLDRNLYVSSENISGEFELYIMSLNGKKIEQKSIKLDTNENSIIPLGNLPVGMYFVNLKGANKNMASKFIVQ